MFHVYIIYSPTRGKYYIGYTEHLEERLERHNRGGSTATKGGEPWTLCHTEEFSSRSEAMTREYAIKKKKSKRYIEWLISQADD